MASRITAIVLQFLEADGQCSRQTIYHTYVHGPEAIIALSEKHISLSGFAPHPLCPPLVRSQNNNEFRANPVFDSLKKVQSVTLRVGCLIHRLGARFG
jgi:hypothetical protein